MAGTSTGVPASVTAQRVRLARALPHIPRTRAALRDGTVFHWADGGATSLSNLVLLCRRHHRLVHEGFGVRMGDGVPVFTREDGTILDDRGPP